MPILVAQGGKEPVHAVETEHVLKIRNYTYSHPFMW